MRKAFTLVELLIVIGIIGILLAVSVFGLKGARESARDAKRKADLESVRSGLELYKSDCSIYPVAGTANGQLDWTDPSNNILVGSGNPAASCPTTNIYLTGPITDPTSSVTSYRYARLSNTSYELCARLEGVTTGTSCGGNCGTIACNYRLTQP